MTEPKPKEFNPLAFNILRLQNYTSYFDLSEIVLFEWLMVKASSFRKVDEFYYSIRRIAGETKIKKAQLATIIKRFETLGIINIERKGMPKCSYFTVNKESVLLLIPEIYQFTENGKLLPENGKLLSYFGKLLPENSKHKGTYKEPIKEPISNLGNDEEKNMVVDDSTTARSFSKNISGDPKKIQAEKLRAQRLAEQEAKEKSNSIDRLMNLLNNTYAERLEDYNAEQEKGGRTKCVSKLSFLNRSKEALYVLGQQQGTNEIQSSFIAYVDHVLNGGIEVKRIIPYFLHRKPKTKDFDVFHTYLDKFITNYSHDKN